MSQESGRRSQAAQDDRATFQGHGTTPLSPAQEGLWFLEQVEDAGVSHHISAAVRLRGDLDLPALGKAMADLVARHEALRATFHIVDGQPRQQFHPAVDGELDFISVEPETFRGTLIPIAERMRSMAEEAFDLEAGPVFRSTLFREDTDSHILTVQLHHLVGDGWSCRLLVKELGERYGAHVRLDDSPVAPPTLEFHSYVEQRRAFRETVGGVNQLTYWEDHLRGAPPRTAMPHDFVRVGAASHVGATRTTLLNADISKRIRSIAAAERSTLFMATFAGLAVMLKRSTGQDDLVVGTPVADRVNPSFQEMIGYLVSTLPLRVNVADQTTFKELIMQVRAEVVRVLARREAQFQDLVRILKPDRDPSSHPIFQMMFTCQESEWLTKAEFPDLAVEPVSLPRDVAQFDMSLAITEADGDRLQVECEFAADLFSVETVDRILLRYAVIMEDLVSRPDAPISSIAVLSEEERGLVVDEWNETDTPSEAWLSVADMVQLQVTEQPEAKAIVDGNDWISYRALGEESTSVAASLVARGIGYGDRVAIYANRSIRTFEAVLGVLMAGAAYVPIEPSANSALVSRVLMNSGCTLVLHDGTLDLPSDLGGSEPLALEDLPRTTNDSVALPAAKPDDLAYVIYTSGTTGEPKGVMIQHGALSNYVTAAGALYEMTSDDRVLQGTSLAFDWSIDEILTPLTRGSTILVENHLAFAAPAKLLERWDQDRVSVLMLPPVLLGPILTALESGSIVPPSLRLLVTGGERLPVELCARWFDHCQVPLFNGYGPTEATVTTTFFLVTRETPLGSTIPIGRPIANSRVYILDNNLAPTPIGVPGEIFIGGAGVAQGYLGDDALTSQRFPVDPFHDNGTRMYRTGDLGRYSGSGNIEFIGRLDNQVKVRGYRVELGAIEAELMTHPAVSQAVVVTQGEPNAKILAHVVPSGDKSASAKALRGHLRRALPEHMIPSAFFEVPAIPVTVQGKVDYSALANIAVSAEPEADFVPPETDDEALLVRVFKRVLSRDDVGIRNNFFDLGGDSIMSIEVVAGAAAAGLEISPIDIFQHQTIESLATVARKLQITEPGPTEAGTLLPPGLLGQLRENDPSVEDAYPLSPLQLGMLFHSLADPEAHFYLNQDLERWTGPLDVRILHEAWLHVIRRHAILRTTFRIEGVDEPVQEVHKDVRLPFREIDITHCAPKEQRSRVSTFLSNDLEEGLDLESGPVIRMAVFKLAGNAHEVVTTWHHILGDARSHDLIRRDLIDRYSSLIRGIDIPEPIPPRPFRDHISWIRSQDIAPAKHYWKQTLNGFTASPGGVFSEPQGKGLPAALEVSLSPKDTDGITEFAQRRRLTINTLGLASFALALARRSASADVCFGTTSSGRPTSLTGAQDMVGLFATTLPVRVNLNGERSVDEVLEGLQRNQLEAREFDYASLSEIASWSSVPPGNPLFETLFGFDAAPIAAEFPAELDLAVEFVAGRGATNYPLVVSMSASNTISLEAGFDSSRIKEDSVKGFLDLMAEILCEFPTLEGARMSQLGLSGQAMNPNGSSSHPLSQAAGEQPIDVGVDSAMQLENAVADIWASILGLDVVTSNDNFFALGGHSMLAMIIIGRIRSKLGKVVPISAMWDTQSLHEFAERVESAPEKTG